MQYIFNVVIVGAGSIGALKDDKYDSKYNNERILTHAHAFHENPMCNLLGIVDTNGIKAADAQLKWDFQYISNNVKYFKDFNVDIVVIASPTETHLSVLKEVLEYLQPKAIIIEKPVGETVEDAYEVNNILFSDQISKGRNIVYLVDYIRRFTYTTRVLKKELEEANTIYNITVRYTRGIKHEACHAIDMICNLLEINHPKELKINIFPYKILDRSEEDPSITVHMSHKKCGNILFLPSDGRDHSIFEIDIHTNKGRYILHNHGALYKKIKVVPEEIYGDYDNLDSNHFVVEKVDLHTALSNLVDHTIMCIEGIEKPLCTPKDALLVHMILDKIQEKYNA